MASRHFVAMDFLDKVERMTSHTPRRSGDEWLLQVRRLIPALRAAGPWPMAARVKLEIICLDAVRAGNGAIFWTALQLAGECFLRGWPLPRNDDLAYLVRAYAYVTERGKMPSVTTAEAAKVLGYTDRHVRRLVKCGRLRAKRMPAGYLEVNNDDVNQLAREKAK